MLNDASSKPSVSPEQLIIDQVADAFVSFSSVGRASFQQMSAAHGNKLAIRNADTIYDRVMDQFEKSFLALKAELQSNCSTISLSFDNWTTKSNLLIFAVIGHWIGLDWIYQKTVLEVTALKGVHSGENIALIVYNALRNLSIMHKLLATTSDSASNNRTLVPHLHQHLLKHFNNELDDEFEVEVNMKLLMQYQGVKSHIYCLAHALNRIVSNILGELKSRTMKETQDRDNDVTTASPVAKLQYIVVWIGRSPQRIKHQEQLSTNNVDFEIDNRWNSTHDMIYDAIRCKGPLLQIVKDYLDDLKEQSLGSADWLFLAQLYTVLNPFNDFTKLASKGRPTISTI